MGFELNAKFDGRCSIGGRRAGWRRLGVDVLDELLVDLQDDGTPELQRRAQLAAGDREVARHHHELLYLLRATHRALVGRVDRALHRLAHRLLEHRTRRRVERAAGRQARLVHVGETLGVWQAAALFEEVFHWRRQAISGHQRVGVQFGAHRHHHQEVLALVADEHHAAHKGQHRLDRILNRNGRHVLAASSDYQLFDASCVSNKCTELFFHYMY